MSGSKSSRSRQGAESCVLREQHTKPSWLDTDSIDKSVPASADPQSSPENLMLNVCRVEVPDDMCAYQYHVDFIPPIDSKKMRVDLLKDHNRDTKVFNVSNLIFNGQIMYLPQPIEIDDFDIKHPVTGATHKIKVRFTSQLKSNPPDAQLMTVLNTVNRDAMAAAGYKLYGRNYFNPALPAHVEIQDRNEGLVRIIIWPGMASAIKPYENGLRMTCEPIVKLIRDQTVLEVIMRAKSRSANAAQAQSAIKTELCGKTVVTTYSNKTYRVDDIIFEKTPFTQTFLRHDGSEQSIADYTVQNYLSEIGPDVTIDPQQPLIMVRAKKLGPGRHDTEAKNADILYLIPQFLRMTGLTPEMRMKRNVMQELAAYNRLSPDRRVSLARHHLDTMTQGLPDQILNEWSIKLDKDLVRLAFRRLNPPLMYGGDNKKFVYSRDTADWTRELKQVKVLDAKPLRNGKWFLIYSGVQAGDAQAFFKSMQGVGKRCGIDVENAIVQLAGQTAGDICGAYATLYENHGPPSIVLVFTNNSEKGHYDMIKCAITRSGVPSQIVLSNSIQREKIRDSIALKVLMQMNCKLGGSLWRVDNPFWTKAQKRIMVVGYDCYTDSSERGAKVVSGVFSMDPNITKYYSLHKPYNSDLEATDNLGRMFQEALPEFMKNNENELPESVILYRDGVGEGQVPVVYQNEVPRVRNVLIEFGKKFDRPAPKLVFIIVNKSIDQRFFKLRGQSILNPEPGTVVDNEITRYERYDFYMAPQVVNHGTVTPVSYNVIFDEKHLKPLNLQRFTWYLCHNYFNWQGTIRVPSPTMYASKLAFQTSQTLGSGEVTNEMKAKLFYL